MMVNEFESTLDSLEARCGELLQVLKQERTALKSWNMQLIEAAAARKVEALDAVRLANERSSAAHSRLCAYLGCTAADLLSRREFETVRRKKQQIHRLGELISQEAELNRNASEHMLRFVGRLTGQEERDTAVGYFQWESKQSGRHFYGVV